MKAALFLEMLSQPVWRWNPEMVACATHKNEMTEEKCVKPVLTNDLQD